MSENPMSEIPSLIARSTYLGMVQKKRANIQRI
jgi:hypothetical protein